MWRFVIVAIVAVVVLAAFISSRKGTVAVRYDRATKQDLITSISTNGKVEPIQNFEAHSPAPTTVRKLYVREGQHVRAGELLMQLEDSDVRAQAAKALAQVKASEADQHAIQLVRGSSRTATARQCLGKQPKLLSRAQRAPRAVTKGAACPG